MESPIVLEKPPEYHGNANSDRGFPFDEEEGSGAWSELAARHPDIAARLRQRPATWARKRRPSSQDAAEDFGDDFGSFNRFPFDDIPPEFREHFPSRWNRRFSERDETQPQPQSAPAQPQSPQHQTAATQTEFHPETSEDQHTHLPQYGLRNTVDLGQKSPADPSLASDEDRGQRSMSAPPDSRAHNQSTANKMNGQNHEPGHSTQQEHQQSSHVRHIPIFVEGRDEPVINKTVDHGAHFGDTKPAYVPPPPPPQQPHIDREQYFDDGPATFHHPPNFSRSFGTPFNQGYRQGPQPFVQQKVYPQTAFTRGASPQRSQSPKPPQPHSEEHFVKVPVHHENTTAPSKPQPKQQPPAPQPKPAPHPQQPPPPQREASPQPKQPSPSNDPITQILSIQTDVLNLMTDVENFTGTKKDKRYIYLDEMLTRNLIKLDNIETDGKENIRQARKEAIRCIQKCIAVLEAKADNRGVAAPQTQDVEMKENNETEKQETEKPEGDKENGEVEMKEVTKEESNVEPQKQEDQPNAQPQEEKVEKKNEQPQVEKKTEQPQVEKETEPKQADKEEQKPVEAKKEAQETVAEDTRPEEKAPEPAVAKQDEKKSETNAEKQPTPKKGTKNVKKRDKSKDKKKDEPKETSNKDEKVDEKKEEAMQVDAKGDKDSQPMDVDCASASQ